MNFYGQFWAQSTLDASINLPEIPFPLMLLASGVNTQQQVPFSCYLVYEVERHCPLADAHLLALPVLAVVGADFVDTRVQLSRRFVFHPVLLALQCKNTSHVNTT